MSHTHDEQSPDAGSGDVGRPGTGGPLARLFLGQLLAVLAITAVLTAAFVVVQGDDGTTSTALDQSQSGTPSPPVSSAPAATTPPASTTPPATTPPASTPPPASTTAPATTPPASPDPGRPEVVVFNQSAPSGSGEAAAQQLTAAGWIVFKVDDFRGSVSETTVYYPPGLEKAARRAARVLPGDVRIREKFSNLSDTRLTLILTDDYGT